MGSGILGHGYLPNHRVSEPHLTLKLPPSFYFVPGQSLQLTKIKTRTFIVIASGNTGPAH